MLEKESKNIKTLTIDISTIEKVKMFSTIAATCSFDTTIKTGRYVVDAKSIMGLFSLDVSKPLELILEFGIDQTDEVDAFIMLIEKFTVKA